MNYQKQKEEMEDLEAQENKNMDRGELNYRVYGTLVMLGLLVAGALLIGYILN